MLKTWKIIKRLDVQETAQFCTDQRGQPKHTNEWGRGRETELYRYIFTEVLRNPKIQVSYMFSTTEFYRWGGPLLQAYEQRLSYAVPCGFCFSAFMNFRTVGLFRSCDAVFFKKGTGHAFE